MNMNPTATSIIATVLVVHFQSADGQKTSPIFRVVSWMIQGTVRLAKSFLKNLEHNCATMIHNGGTSNSLFSLFSAADNATVVEIVKSALVISLREIVEFKDTQTKNRWQHLELNKKQCYKRAITSE
jgi:hypothetical protein